FSDNAIAREFIQSLSPGEASRVTQEPGSFVDEGVYQAVLFEGRRAGLIKLNKQVAARPGPIISVQGLSPDEIEQGAQYRPTRLLREVSTSINTAAAGGNASLMMVG